MTSTLRGRIRGVPTLNIKDPEVYALAQELARWRRTSMTAAIRQSLEESVTEARRSREGIADRLMEIGRRSREKIDRLGIVPLTDEDLYDERGLPR